MTGIDYSIRRYHEYTDEEIIERLKSYAQENKKEFVALTVFTRETGISQNAILRRFGTWTKLCKIAALNPKYARSVTKDSLFENLDNVWAYLKRQPRTKEMCQPISRISITQYNKFFKKSWFDICSEFLTWREAKLLNEKTSEGVRKINSSDSGKKFDSISDSTRYRVLNRDKFKCVKCGRSPATDNSVILHVDHILPESKGGTNHLDNLQAMCSRCNFGKSNRFTG